MIRKEMIAMLLAAGQGSRLGVLTANMAKPAVSYGGKYRIIDFPLSNCINSGIDTVGVLTQYQPLRLNTHIGIGIPWDLDRNVGGVSILPPFEKENNSAEWYSGTANAVYQNIRFMEYYNPEYVLILSGDHVYKMDYEIMLNYHKSCHADVTMATYAVPAEDAVKYNIVVSDGNNRLTDIEEKPVKPGSNMASMGVYIFNWKVLREALKALSDKPGCDFEKHVIPYCREKGAEIYAYEYHGYWKDVANLSAYWESNMELIDLIPDFNLYEEFWKIYTKSDVLPPQYIAATATVSRSIIGEGSEIYGEVRNSVVGPGVTVGEGTVVEDSIVMEGTVIGRNCRISKAIIAENAEIGDSCEIGAGEEKENKKHPNIYCDGLATIGEKSVVPANVKIGKNTVISGITGLSDYKKGCLASGECLMKAGERG